MKIKNFKKFNESIYDDTTLYVSDKRVEDYYSNNSNDDFHIKYEYYIEEALYDLNELNYLIDYNTKNVLFLYKYKNNINSKIFDTDIFKNNYEIELKKNKASKFNI
jgi:hypothetical protein